MASFLAWLVSRVKCTHYVVDERIPASALVSVAGRRMIWLLRGSAKLLIFQRHLRLIFMGPGAQLQNASMIRFGRAVTLGPGTIVDGLAEQGVELGDNVTIGAYSIVRSTGVLTKLGVGVRMGRNSSIDAYSFIGAAGGVFIGENVIMGQHISFHAEDHDYSRMDCPIRDQGTRRKGIVVEDDCWIGSNVTFLDGVHVGRGCVIGAGAVVNGTIPDYSVAVGIPARVVATRGASSRDSAETNPELAAPARRSG
jgi:acetyltransferase-like isoleucine patch superfamily enzyme